MVSACNYGRYDLDLLGIHLEGKYVFYGAIFVILLVVMYGLNKFLSGAWCNLSKDMTGKNVVITGGNDGIGRQTAKRLLQLNGNVIIGSRDEQKNKETVEQFSKIGKGKIIAFKLDLGDKDSIQKFAANVQKQLKDQPLHYLLNNAGVATLPELRKTKQNLEMQIGVNHFGHFYLTYLLWQKLKSSKNPRIINVSSQAHKFNFKNGDMDFNNLHYQNGGYAMFPAYSRSKKANILFTRELQKRMDQEGVNGVAVSLHPGAVKTGLAKHYIGDSSIKKFLNKLILVPFMSVFFKNSTQGAQTNIYCILQDDQKLTKGGYYSDCRLTKTQSPEVVNSEIAQKLWIQCEKAFGIKFSI